MLASIAISLVGESCCEKDRELKMETFGGHVPRNHHTWNEQKADVMQQTN